MERWPWEIFHFVQEQSQVEARPKSQGNASKDQLIRSVALVKNVVVLFLALCRVFKSMEPLTFDSLAETDVVRRFPNSAKVFVYI